MKKVALFLMFLTAAGTVLAQQTAPLVTRDQPYRLQASDVLEVEYVYTPEYNQVASVEPDGSLRLKLIGSLKVEGLTLEEATSAIKARAAVPLNAPEVTVTLKEYVKPHFTVYGEVDHPGIYDMHGSVTLLQGIAMTGGLKETAKDKKVLLVRKVNADFAEVRVIDAKALSSAQGAREDFVLKPNDMLIVPKNTIGKLEPYVRVASLALGSLYGVQVLK